MSETVPARDETLISTSAARKQNESSYKAHRAAVRKRRRNSEDQGAAGDPLHEKGSRFNSLKCEKVNKNGGSYIVMGRDRKKGILSGYGGEAHTGCSSIDIVVGRLGHTYPQHIRTARGQRMYINPDFQNDAARIYLSQKTNIDEYLGIKMSDSEAEGASEPRHIYEVGESIAKSAVGIKADAVRIVGREGIKLVTRVGAKNSLGGDLSSVQGIDLIAGNHPHGLQPLVKGKNLVNALEELGRLLQNLGDVTADFAKAQITYNGHLASHFHFSPFFGIATSASPVAEINGTKTTIKQTSVDMKSLYHFATNVSLWQGDWLDPAVQSNNAQFADAIVPDYICSSYNTTN